MVQMLLDNGAVVNETNVNGDTALHYAVRLGREDLVKVINNATSIERALIMFLDPFPVHFDKTKYLMEISVDTKD